MPKNPNLDKPEQKEGHRGHREGTEIHGVFDSGEFVHDLWA